MDTIFAVSSGQPPAAIAILRLSGAGALDAVRALAGDVPAPRRAALRALRQDGELLDRALVLIFPGPDSATGEDLAELHLHGGRAVVRAVEAALASIPGLRSAEPGEFTRRALANGRIDLSEAEGLGDLLMAETEAQRRAAIRSAEGAVRREVEGWASRTLGVAAQIEAMLDHSDEEDVDAEAEVMPGIRAAALALAAEIEAIVAQPPVERLRDGIRVVLSGPPNAGKSTLLNAMADRTAAIVSPIAGTTRDRIEAPVVRDGIAWLLIDTAGLTETEDVVERIGVGLARDAMDEADIVLWLGDDAPPEHPALIHVKPRSDQPGRGEGGDRLPVSAATGAGMERLWQAMRELGEDLLPRSDRLALNRRQRDLTATAGRALRAAASEGDMLLTAEQLRTALRAFDAITGRADVEAMLDALFSRFCIGK
ncbi:tRNA uridine-5-carboxymethylaminomethyl(34) synthesis GTPase MnmE [Sphingomonas sp. G-3-2-10]|uniref:tRNA uridine-5-carboxymethylaminomethyl(34) synthesis GTPase MnmE n=1 Tax=Sphingomonas sp. G-3-2-10 TaxID=2728838 RepID=UPI00146C8668|nr:tRNA uridine-5-carboxymethylaminomethyl(34) synthesis GTPase MnmE [Sphingomonas sp. G-3-2-10]NML07338.1 tRNA uridine-5-carboxymethylaminomethyl(34) synthesis GTPase MnmE [Sphingomonas sp. G-3-2-10]